MLKFVSKRFLPNYSSNLQCTDSQTVHHHPLIMSSLLDLRAEQVKPAETCTDLLIYCIIDIKHIGAAQASSYPISFFKGPFDSSWSLDSVNSLWHASEIYLSCLQPHKSGDSSCVPSLFSLECSPLSGQTTSHLGHITASQKTLLHTEPSHVDDKSSVWVPLMSWVLWGKI